MKRYLHNSLKILILSVGLGCLGLNGLGQTAIPNTTPITQNFDGMAATQNLPANWKMAASTVSPTWTGSSSTVTQEAATGSPTAGGTYNWGSTVAERSVGVMSSGSFASPSSLIGWFQNTNTSSISQIAITYDCERYRINTAAASLQFYYSTDGSIWTSVPAGDIAAASLPTGTSAYSFNPPQLTINVASFNITGLNIANGSNIYLRWNLATTGSNSQGIGIDNISVTATFASCSAPTISAQPISATKCAGESASFSVSATCATGSLSYQWRKNGVNISGATSSTYSIPSVIAGDAGDYDVIVTCVCGANPTTTSSTASLTVNSLPADPTGSISPAANPACTSTTLTYSAPNAAIYWQTSSSGTSTASPTTSSYTVNSSGNYYVRAYNGSCWSTNSLSSAAITINTPPAISTQPSSVSVSSGSNVVFSVIAAGTSLTYQWQENQGSGWTNVSNGGMYSGATTASLTLTGVLLSMNTWQYQCVVSGACSPSATSNAAVLNVVTTAVGDYRTKTNGNWGVNSSWEKWNGSSWVACASGDFPDNGTASIEILHTIDLDGSGTPPFDCKNLVVSTGAKLWCNNFTGVNSYIQVYGNITCDGTIGSTSGDDISFDIAGGANCTISGTGSFTATRIRKDENINPTTDASLTIAMNVNLTWSSVSGTVIYNDGSGSNFNVTVNSGKILKASGPGPVYANIAIDGNNFSAPDVANSGGTYTVYGAIDLDGILYATTNNTAAGRSCNYVIKNGGRIKCRYVRADASSSSGNSITIESGGRLNFFGSIDTVGSANDTTWARYSTTNNTYDFQSGSIVEYSGFTRQLLNGVSNYRNLIFSGGGLKKLGLNVTADENITFTSGIVQTNSYKLIMTNTIASSLIHSSGSASFVYGTLRRYIANNTSTYEFPLGDGTTSTKYKRLDLINNSLSGITYIDGSVNAISETGNNIDTRIIATQSGNLLTNIFEAAEWNLIPNTPPAGGTYGVRLYVANTGVTAADDNKFCALKRDDASTDYADWNSYESLPTMIPATSTAGRIYNSGNGYAERTGYNTFSKHAIATSITPLPVELTNFKGEYFNKKIKLYWSTASETNNDRFEIEKSENLIAFEIIGTLPGAGNSNIKQSYEFTDDNPLPGNNYYKLKQVDFDGKSSESKIIVVNVIQNPNVNVFVSDNSTISVTSNNSDIDQVEILDVTGKQIYFKSQIHNGDININIPDITPGIYFVRIVSNSFTETRKIYFQ